MTDVAYYLSNLSLEERRSYVTYIKQLNEGANKMKYSQIKLKSKDGDILTKCILENPALLVNRDGDILEISEFECAEILKRGSQVVIPLPRNQEILDELFLGDDLEEFISTYLTLVKIAN